MSESYVTIPSGQNSVSFDVEALSTAQDNQNVTVILTGTDNPLVSIDSLDKVKINIKNDLLMSVNRIRRY
ncbi:MAG: hypothetical protein LBN74_00050 [Prevotella sp.]|nr:hypothetical protein [Prevotella sp.]